MVSRTVWILTFPTEYAIIQSLIDNVEFASQIVSSDCFMIRLQFMQIVGNVVGVLAKSFMYPLWI